MRRSCNLPFPGVWQQVQHLLGGFAVDLVLLSAQQQYRTAQLSCLLKSSGIIERFRRSICSLLIPNCAKLLAGIRENKRLCTDSRNLGERYCPAISTSDSTRCGCRMV